MGVNEMKELRERCADTLSGVVGRMHRPSEGSPLDLLESFAREIRNEALEEAARICERWAEHYDDAGSGHLMCVAVDCECEIRALKSDSTETLAMEANTEKVRELNPHGKDE